MDAARLNLESAEFVAWLRAPYNGGATMVKLLPGGWYGAVRPLLFHWTLIKGQVGDRASYDDRWCYATQHLAEAALVAWSGEGDPDGWHRHPSTGRRREGGDPGRETLAF